MLIKSRYTNGSSSAELRDWFIDWFVRVIRDFAPNWVIERFKE